MDRRAALVVTGAALGSSARGAFAQREMPRIGFITGGAIASNLNDHPFVMGLAARGLVVGKHVLVDWRKTSDGPASRHAEDLVRLGCRLFAVSDDSIALAVRQASPSTPIVLIGSIDPVGSGLAKSLPAPGGSVTGLAWTQDGSIAAKYPEMLSELVPGLTRLGCLIDPGFKGIGKYRAVVEATAQRMGMEVMHLDTPRWEDYEVGFARLVERRMQAVFVYGTNIIFLHRDQLVQAATKHGMPTMYITRTFADAGGLISYGVDINALNFAAGAYVEQILAGANPATLPIRQPEKYELVINRRAARAMNLRLPASLLSRADVLID